MSALSNNRVQTQPAQPSSIAESRRRVLFACCDENWPASALLRAHVFAEQLRDELFVLQVQSQPRATWRFRHTKAPLASLAKLEALEKSHAALLKRCAGILWPGLPNSRFQTTEGDFVETTVMVAAELGAELIVLPPLPRNGGDAAAQVAHAARVPVLVARPGRSQNTVVAATNLRDSRYPVLRHARSVSSMLQADLILVHNVEPAMMIPTPEVATLWLDAMPRTDVAAQTQRLATVAESMPHCVGAVVKCEANTAQAILEASRSCDADLIVVGVARRYSRWERLLRTSVAARVADRAYRSVLLFPVGPPSSESVVMVGA